MAQHLLWLNGETMTLSEGRIPIEDRGFLFADGIYEVVRFVNGRPLMLREHLERYQRSAEEILMDLPGTLEEREELISDLVERSGLQGDVMVYGQLTRGVAPRNHIFPDPAVTPPTELWFVKPTPHHPKERYEHGVPLLSLADERWGNCHIKSIALLPNCIAKEKARRAGCFEALLYNEDRQHVTECGASNAYCVRDGVIFTHPLGKRILPGVARMMILDVARDLGIEVREEACTLAEFKAAEEVFISSTTMDAMPATQIDGAPVGEGRVGPVMQRLVRACRERVAELTGASVVRA